MRVSSTPFSKYATVVAISALLTACGGGGSDPEDEGTGGAGGGGQSSTGIGGSPLFDGGMVGDSDRACNASQGTDNDSADFDWSNNCSIQVDPTENEVSETFAKSYYTTGIQRIVWCLGHAADFEMTDFIDQDYGPRTRAAVESFQSLEGLNPDGIVGTLTWEALQNALTEVGSDDFSVAWAIADPLYTDFSDPIYESDCEIQPAFWEYLYPDENVKAWTLTDRDAADALDTTTFGRTEEIFFGNTF